MYIENTFLTSDMILIFIGSVSYQLFARLRLRNDFTFQYPNEVGIVQTQ